MGKYEKAKDGQLLQFLDGEVFKHACCDCGLVHQVHVEINNGKVELTFFRDARATGGKRATKAAGLQKADNVSGFALVEREQ